jgi:hypothetical protein
MKNFNTQSQARNSDADMSDGFRDFGTPLLSDVPENLDDPNGIFGPNFINAILSLFSNVSGVADSIKGTYVDSTSEYSADNPYACSIVPVLTSIANFAQAILSKFSEFDEQFSSRVSDIFSIATNFASNFNCGD